MKEKVLVVEDNPQSLRLIEMTLSARGYALLKATDGREAINVAVGGCPDFIIMDIQLPGMSGLDVISRLRQIPEFSDIPIVALTACAAEDDRERYAEAGFDACLSKPVNTRELPEVVAGILAERKQGNLHH